MMDWKDLGKQVVGASPLIGAVLGGPAGAAVGSALAKFAGVQETASAVLEAVSKDGKLQEFELKHEAEILAMDLEARIAELKADTATVTAVNGTMQAESVSEHFVQYAWRPIWGFASAAAFLFVSLLFCFLAYVAIIQRQPEALKMVPELISAFSMLFATPAAILGVASYWRGKEKLSKSSN